MTIRQTKPRLPKRLRAAWRALWPRAVTYSRPYATWGEAKAHAVGYDAPEILAAIRDAALAVKRGEAAYERGAVAYVLPQYRWPLLSCLLHAQTRKAERDTFHVLDFGGSLGSVYFQHDSFLDGIPKLLWSVVDRPHVVACGNAEFADGRLAFFDTIGEAVTRAPLDLAIFSGSLEYVDLPYEVLAEVANAGCTHLILDMLHLTDSATDEFRVQKARPPGPPRYPARLAIRFLSAAGLRHYLEGLGYRIVTTMPAGGFYCERRL